MPHDILLLHDFNPYSFYLLPFLHQCLGDDFSLIEAGDIARPLTNAELQPLLLRDPATRVAWIAGAQPIGRVLRKLNADSGFQVRSLLPIVHPFSRIMHLFHRRVAFDDLAGGTAPADADLAWYVEHGLAVARNSIPAANYQAAHLLGGFWGRDLEPDAVAALGRLICETAIPVLADFPALSQCQMFGALLAAGKPLDARNYVAPDLAGDLAGLVRAVRDRLPRALFDELCARNAADLALFRTVAEHVADHAPLSAAGRGELRDCIGQALEIAASGPPPVKATTGFVTADPVLGWRAAPNAHRPMMVRGRSVDMDTDGFGLRPVPRQPATGNVTLALYGCSCTFGWSVAAEDTFAALLQRMFPDWRVENHGVIGYGPMQNLLELQRDSRFEPADIVTFCQIPSHGLRAAADFSIVAAYQQHPLLVSTVQTYPKAYLDRAGELRLRQIEFRRPDILGIDHVDFMPDEHYLDLLCLRIYQRAAEMVRGNGGRFFVTLLNEPPSDFLLAALRDADIPVVDAGAVGDAFTNLPDDAHPNEQAHRRFAEQIGDYLHASLRGM